MKAVVTSGFIESIPEKIRAKLHLQAGMVLDFDESTPFLKATASPESSGQVDEFKEWLAASVGVAKGRFTTDELMRESRGED
ncbi:hypothetical protein [Haloferula sp. BvORR071]|uniref:hypothetical protein n=1 Tax=Haloferula sp. BvORR071 TaxID=1396141 RepID=UPI0005551D92|nr:hypothetical protein [Haloferula sp. BvORR071]